MVMNDGTLEREQYRIVRAKAPTVALWSLGSTELYLVTRREHRYEVDRRKKKAA